MLCRVYTIQSQLMGAIIAMGLNQQGLKQAVAVESPPGDALSESLALLRPLRQEFKADGLYLIDREGVIVGT